MTRIYKNMGKGGNGEVVITTTASDLRQLESEIGSAALEALKKNEGDEQFFLDSFFPNLFQLAFKVAGYKADGVREERFLVSGHSSPDESKLLAEYPTPAITEGRRAN